jgi:phosphotriesterase-related protein
VDGVYPAADRVYETDEEALARRIAGEFANGVGASAIKPGFIGEVGCSWPMTETEIKVLRASARAQRLSGAALMVHPGRDRQAPFRIVDILGEAGADLGRTIICHIDRTLADKGELCRLARTGCVLEFDLFGFEGSYYAWDLPVDMPNDLGRATLIKWLIGEGFGRQITISHDIAFKDKLARYGGPGYAHILKNAVPMMRRKGIAEAALHDILVETPRRLLTLT